MELSRAFSPAGSTQHMQGFRFFSSFSIDRVCNEAPLCCHRDEDDPWGKKLTGNAASSVRAGWEINMLQSTRLRYVAITSISFGRMDVPLKGRRALIRPAPFHPRKTLDKGTHPYKVTLETRGSRIMDGSSFDVSTSQEAAGGWNRNQQFNVPYGSNFAQQGLTDTRLFVSHFCTFTV